MAKKLYEETDIQAIADSIRGKCGTTCGYKVCDMADAITNIPTSGGGGGESKGVIVKRANPLPICLPYHHQSGTSAKYQFHYLTFIWPAGVEQLYLNHDYSPTTSTTDSYKMAEISLDFGKNMWPAVPSGLDSPALVSVSANIPDFGTSYDGSLTNIVSRTGKLFNSNSSALENFKYTLKASSYFNSTPPEDTVCMIRIRTKGYGSNASMIGILTVQEEAFE